MYRPLRAGESAALHSLGVLPGPLLHHDRKEGTDNGNNEGQKPEGVHANGSYGRSVGICAQSSSEIEILTFVVQEPDELSQKDGGLVTCSIGR